MYFCTLQIPRQILFSIPWPAFTFAPDFKGGGGIMYFCRFRLTIIKALLTDIKTRMEAENITGNNVHFRHEINLRKYNIYERSNFEPTAVVQTTNRNSKERWPTEKGWLVALISIKYIILWSLPCGSPLSRMQKFYLFFICSSTIQKHAFLFCSNFSRMQKIYNFQFPCSRTQKHFLLWKSDPVNQEYVINFPREEGGGAPPFPENTQILLSYLLAHKDYYVIY